MLWVHWMNQYWLSIFWILLIYQVKFVMDDETTLADLLALNLHNFEDEVRNIVDKATKELSMEKVLAELNNTWSVMEFEYENHYRTGISLLRTSEELIETLEDNQVSLWSRRFSICCKIFDVCLTIWWPPGIRGWKWQRSNSFWRSFHEGFMFFIIKIFYKARVDREQDIGNSINL